MTHADRLQTGDVLGAVQVLTEIAALAAATASRNSTLSGAYFMIAARALGIEAFAQELDEGHARNFDRVLEAQEQPGGGALVRFQFQQVLAQAFD